MSAMRQTMWDMVRLYSRPGKWFWRRPLNMGDKVMVIPVVDGVPIVHEFMIVEKKDVIGEESNRGTR